MKWTSLLAQGWTKIPGAQQGIVKNITKREFIDNFNKNDVSFKI